MADYITVQSKKIGNVLFELEVAFDELGFSLKRSMWAFQEMIASWQAAESEFAADRFESYPRWRRIVQLMAIGAYLEER